MSLYPAQSVQLVRECARWLKRRLVGSTRLNQWDSTSERPICTAKVQWFWCTFELFCFPFVSCFIFSLVYKWVICDSVFFCAICNFSALSSIIGISPVAHWCSVDEPIFATHLHRALSLFFVQMCISRLFQTKHHCVRQVEWFVLSVSNSHNPIRFGFGTVHHQRHVRSQHSGQVSTWRYSGRVSSSIHPHVRTAGQHHGDAPALEGGVGYGGHVVVASGRIIERHIHTGSIVYFTARRVDLARTDGTHRTRQLFHTGDCLWVARLGCHSSHTSFVIGVHKRYELVIIVFYLQVVCTGCVGQIHGQVGSKGV